MKNIATDEHVESNMLYATLFMLNCSTTNQHLLQQTKIAFSNYVSN